MQRGNVFTKHTYLQVSHWPIGKKNHGFGDNGDQCDDSTNISVLSLAGACSHLPLPILNPCHKNPVYIYMCVLREVQICKFRTITRTGNCTFQNSDLNWREDWLS